MYDFKEMQEFDSITVADLVTLLMKYPSGTRVRVGNSSHGYIHSDTDDFVVSLDSSPMQKEYEKIEAIKRERTRRAYE